MSRPVTVQGHHPDLDDVHDTIINRLIAEQPDARYASALAARRAIEGAVWATRLAKRAHASPATRDHLPQTTNTSADRDAPPRRGGDRHDAWLGRDIYVLDLEDHLTRASAFARADHPVLATVFRANAEAREIWIEVLAGRPLSQGLSLTRLQHAELRAAIDALHAAGGAHGAVDASHVYVHAGHARLAFPRTCRPADPAADIAAWEALAPGE